MVMSTAWLCQQHGHVNSMHGCGNCMVVSTAWLFQQHGHVNSVHGRVNSMHSHVNSMHGGQEEQEQHSVGLGCPGGFCQTAKLGLQHAPNHPPFCMVQQSDIHAQSIPVIWKKDDFQGGMSWFCVVVDGHCQHKPMIL